MGNLKQAHSEKTSADKRNARSEFPSVPDPDDAVVAGGGQTVRLEGVERQRVHSRGVGGDVRQRLREGDKERAVEQAGQKAKRKQRRIGAGHRQARQTANRRHYRLKDRRTFPPYTPRVRLSQRQSLRSSLTEANSEASRGHHSTSWKGRRTAC